jgi:hypothetical protein
MDGESKLFTAPGVFGRDRQLRYKIKDDTIQAGDDSVANRHEKAKVDAAVVEDNRKKWQDNRVIVHLDMDAFFAAIEQQHCPGIRGKPVIIGGLPGGRGVVSTCSYEARAYGICNAGDGGLQAVP